MKIDCQTAQEWIPASLLGALEVDEQIALFEHVRECASCRAEADALLPARDALAFSAPDAGEPSPQVKQRVLAAIHEDPRPRAAAQPRRHRVRWWRWTAVLVPAAAALILIVGLGAGLASLQSQVAQQQARLERLTQIQTALQQFMLKQNVQTVPVKLTGSAASASAVLYVSGDEVAMSVTGLPPLAGNSVYQCWWSNAQTGEMMAGSFFKVDANGAGVWVWQVPNGGEYGQMTITLENHPGNTQIEGPVMMTANL